MNNYTSSIRRRYTLYGFIASLLLMMSSTPLQVHEINTAIVQISLQDDNHIQLVVKASLETLLTGTANLPAGSDSADHGDDYQKLRALSPPNWSRKATLL